MSRLIEQWGWANLINHLVSVVCCLWTVNFVIRLPWMPSLILSKISKLCKLGLYCKQFWKISHIVWIQTQSLSSFNSIDISINARSAVSTGSTSVPALPTLCMQPRLSQRAAPMHSHHALCLQNLRRTSKHNRIRIVNCDFALLMYWGNTGCS